MMIGFSGSHQDRHQLSRALMPVTDQSWDVLRNFVSLEPHHQATQCVPLSPSGAHIEYRGIRTNKRLDERRQGPLRTTSQKQSAFLRQNRETTPEIGENGGQEELMIASDRVMSQATHTSIRRTHIIRVASFCEGCHVSDGDTLGLELDGQITSATIPLLSPGQPSVEERATH